MPMHIEVPEGVKGLSAEECGKCHPEIYREWAGSMHAKAWTDPYFQVDFVYDGSMQICLNCHTPLANQQENLVLGFKDKEKFQPILKPNPDFDPLLRDEGVTCAVCHIRDGKILGPFETDEAPHPVIVDPQISSGMKPCERCHVVGGDRWDTFYRIPPCGTVAELKESGEEIDCLKCHMPAIERPAAVGMKKRVVRQHLFMGGHYPEMVRKDLKVEFWREAMPDRDTVSFRFALTNLGTDHYLPTGTPDRHLTLELRLLDEEGKIIKEKVYTMKRYIMWRPFIVDLKDTRLPYGVPRSYLFNFSSGGNNPPAALDVTVRYHLLDEERRKEIGYQNSEPISYPVYRKRIQL